METNPPDPIRPETLHEGGSYAWHLKSGCQQGEEWEWVRLVGYTACPAVVIVSQEAGAILPVARDELFLFSV
jgi:hypothetical protein